MAESKLYVGKDKDGKTVVGAYNDFAIENREELVANAREAVKANYSGHIRDHIENELGYKLAIATEKDLRKFPRLPEASISITYLDERGQGALCHKFDGQSSPQGCYIELDTDNGTMNADYNSGIGNAVPQAVYDGVVRRYEMPLLSAESANDLMNEIAPLVDQVMKNFEKDASAIDDVEVKIERICNEYESDIESVDLNIWFRNGYPDEITAFTGDDELKKIAESQEMDLNDYYKGEGLHYVLEDDIFDILKDARDEMVKEAVADPEGAGFGVERIELIEDGQAVIHLTHGDAHYAAIRGTDGDFEVCAASSIQTDGEDRHNTFAANFGPHIDDVLEELGVPTAKDKYLDLVAHDDVINPKGANIDEIVANLRLSAIELNDAPGGYEAIYELSNPDDESCASISLRHKELLGGEVGDWVFTWSNMPEEELHREDIARILEENFDAFKVTKALNLPENYLDIMDAHNYVFVEDRMTEPLSLVEQLRDGYAVNSDLESGYYLDEPEAAAFYEENLADKKFIEARNDNESVELFACDDGGGALVAHWTRGDDGRMHIQSVTAVPEEEATKLQTPEKGTIPEAWREAGIQEPEKESEVER